MQQQAAGAATVGVEPETGRQLFRAGEVVGQAFRQVHPFQGDDPLVALALDRVHGEGQHAFGHQLLHAGIGADGFRRIAGQATHLAVAGTLHHQQRNRAAGARLQYQQAVELERAAEQRGRREHLSEQLRDRFRIGMFGQHFAVAALEIDHLAAHVGIVEKETLALI